MAKKVITPEEYQARIEKKVSRRKIFFGTFTKALAFFLAIAMAYSLAVIAFTPATGVASGTVAAAGDGAGDDKNGSTNGGATGGDASAGNGGSTGGDSTGDNSSTGGDSTGGDTSNSGGSTGAAVSKADAVKLLNDVTAAASKGNYSWKRNCAYTPDGKIDVGNATDTLNKIIKGVDKNASLDSVVGNFIGIGDLGTDVKGGKLPEEGMSEKHLLKAMTLTEGDVVKFANKGTTYLYQLNQCKDPKKDGTNALSKATDDFITHEEVVKGITDAVGSAVKLETSQVTYDSILIQATIDGGKLTKLTLSYTFSAVLNLKVAIAPITGKGKAKMTAEYSNIAY